MRHVTIIGGGITGLATAYYLQKKSRAGGQPCSYTLLESSSRLGGKIISDHVDQFTIEGGPDSFVVEKPWCLQLCHELGLADQLIPSNEIQRKIYVLRHGKLVPLPSGFRLTVPTELKPFLLSPLISPLGKARMALECLIPPRRATGDESLAQFIRRRLGNEALDRIAGPLMAGIFVSDPERMSMMGTFPRVLEMEKKFGSLIRAAQHAHRHPEAPRSPASAGNAMFNALRKGMGSLIEALTHQIEGDVRLSCKVIKIQRAGERLGVVLQDSKEPALTTDAVVLAVPAYVAAGLVETMHSDLARMLREIRYVGTTTISLAYLRTDIPPTLSLDGFGVLVPASEKRRIIACTWASTKFKHRAPPGCVLLRAFVGGPRDEAAAELPDDRLLDAVTDEYASLFGLTNKPLLHRIYRWPKGNPQYDVGHLDRVAQMEEQARTVPGLHLAGSAYHGIGMPDCIKSAIGAVNRILA